jgi:hypothetical protein
MKRIPSVALALAAALGTTACAPDAWQNVRATQFNAYLDTVAAQCQPLWFGNTVVRNFNDSSSGMGPGEFDQLLDLSSRLFYGRISPADFSNAVQSTWLGERSARSAQCMIAKLPAERPATPSGTAYPKVYNKDVEKVLNSTTSQ